MTKLLKRIIFLNLLSAVFLFSACSVTSDEVTSSPFIQPPSNVTVEEGNNQIKISWNSVSGNTYKVYYGIHSGIYDGKNANEGESPIEVNANTITLTGLTNGLDYYIVLTSLNSGIESGYSSEVRVAPVAPNGPPDAPQNLNATAANSTQINLTWLHPDSSEDGFSIERSNSAAGPFSEIGTALGGTNYFEDRPLVATTTYYYRIRAFNENGSSDYSNTISETTDDPPLTPPAAPSGLSASAQSANQILLNWTDNANNEEGFKVERSPNGSSSWAQIGTSGTNVAQYTDSGLNSNTTYYYRVRSYNGAGDSAYTTVASDTTDDSPPAAPSNLIATAQSSSQIILEWSDNSNDESGFKIERSPNGTSSWTQIQITAANATGYQNSGLNSETTYYYRVRAYKGTLHSDYTNVANATTDAPPPTPPLAPSNPNATATGAYSIDISWSDNSDNEENFEIERALSFSGPYTNVGTNNSNDTTFTNTGLSSNTLYYYRIRATNGAGQSAYTSPVSATTDPPPPFNPPTGLTATGANDYERIDVTWNYVSGASGYRLFYSYSSPVTEGGSGVYEYYTTGNSFNISEWPSTRMFFRVKVDESNDDLDSELSAEVSGITKPEQIDYEWIYASPSFNQVNFTFFPWDDSTNDYYLLSYWEEGSGDIYTETTTQTSDYIINGLTDGIRYYFTISSHNESGYGPESSEVVAVTGKPAPTGLYVQNVDCGAGAGSPPPDGDGPWVGAVPCHVNITWNPPSTGETVYGYHLWLDSDDPSVDWYRHVNTTNSTSRLNVGVAEGATYKIYVQAVYSDGAGASSYMQTFCFGDGCN